MIVSVLVRAGLEGVPHRELCTLSRDAITLLVNVRRHRRRGASSKARVTHAQNEVASTI